MSQAMCKDLAKYYLCIFNLILTEEEVWPLESNQNFSHGHEMRAGQVLDIISKGLSYV